MGIVINNNVTALNAWRQLSLSNTKLSKSLEKLSSGLQINRGADNPAGLVISEKLRAQASGLEQAMKNSEDAVSVIQVAEGALQEVHSILNSVRSLAVHAANSGANDDDSISADQSQVDNAIDAISRIANTTKFLGKFLLNGGAGNTASFNSSTSNIDSASISTAATTGYLGYSVTTVATRASFTSTGTNWSATGTITAEDTLTLNGIAISMSVNDTRASVVAKVNARSADTGVYAGTGTNTIQFDANQFGSQYDINVDWSQSATMASTAISGGVYTVGVDIQGNIGGVAATGNGLTLTATGADWSGSSITFTAAGNTTNNAGGYSTTVSVNKSALKFTIGANATTTESIEFGINDMRATALGSAGNGFLANVTNGIRSTDGNRLSVNAAGAVQIIDDAIAAVSNERSKLGAYQKNSIETIQNNLGASLENIQAAESRIRDLDMAKEMMSFTKHQILIQAGTAMLAQANMIPQSALQLIG